MVDPAVRYARIKEKSSGLSVRAESTNLKRNKNNRRLVF